MLVSDLYCPSCRNAKDHKPQDKEICWSCVAMGGAGNYKESKTHGDQLRAMTDEELAEFLLNRDLDVVEKASKAAGFTYTVDREPCLANVIDWLKQEVET